MSNVSRSNQFAPAQTSRERCRPRRSSMSSSPTRVLRRTRWRLRDRVEVEHDLEARRRARDSRRRRGRRTCRSSAPDRRAGSGTTSFQRVGVDDRGVVAELRVRLEDRRRRTCALRSSRTRLAHASLSLLRAELARGAARASAPDLSRGFTIAGRAVAARDLVLQEHEAVEDGLGARRAARARRRRTG